MWHDPSVGRLVICLLVAACSDKAPMATPDAYPPVVPMCTSVRLTASCYGGVATVEFGLYGLGAGSHSMCSEFMTATAPCAAGCTVEFSADHDYPISDTRYTSDPLYALAGAPSLLCAETPRAHAGDPCDVPIKPETAPERRCLPVCADLDGSGAVVAENDLRCNAASVCGSVSAPHVTGYLQACDATVVAQYSGSTGAVVSYYTACLLAWDATMQRALSGRTIPCISDGDCPDGALCDDKLMLLDPQGQRQGVCKPGPRGSLAATPLTPS